MERIDDVEGEILRNEPVVPGYFRVSIRLSKPMSQVRPGQFVMVKVPSTDVFLRRPFSIYDYRRGILSILYKVVGNGTAVLSEARAREKVMILGPLGNGFTALPGHDPILVGGGIGIAGIHLLWSRLKGRKTLFWGCTSNAEVGLIDRIIPCEPHVSTMDGSFGCMGNVVDLLGQHLPHLKKPIQVFACGPEAMFLPLREKLRDGHIACQVLVEERMACGLGICFGCAKKTLDESEPYKRVCKEGPVFDLWQISIKLFGKRLRNPVMNASGTLGYGSEIEPLWRVDEMGCYVSKGLSVLPHHGNPSPRLWEEKSALINSVGLQNVGLGRFFAEKFPLFQERNTPVIINFFGFTEEDYVKCAEAIKPDRLIVALEINLSCPNIKQGGICLGKEADGVFRIIRRVKGVTSLPVVAKLTPEVTDIVGIARAAYEAGADGITVLNTFPAASVDVEGGRPGLRGGLSGPFLKPMALRAVADISGSVPVPIIGTGGIMDHRDALSFLMAGAAAVQVGTASFIDPFAIPRIVKGIDTFLESRHIPRVGQIIGTARAQG